MSNLEGDKYGTPGEYEAVKNGSQLYKLSAK